MTRRFGGPGLSAAIVLFALAAVGTVALGATGLKILLVGAGNLDDTHDGLLYEHFRAAGHDVTCMSAEDATGGESGYNVVFISARAPSGVIAGKFRDSPLPVVASKAHIYGYMGMTGDGSPDYYETLTGVNEIVITAPDLPLAAGFGGTVAPFVRAAHHGAANPPATATVVAVGASDPRPVLIAYEAGDQMVGMTAPARRVGFFMTTHADRLSQVGWQLVDAAVAWAAGR